MMMDSSSAEEEFLTACDGSASSHGAGTAVAARGLSPKLNRAMQMHALLEFVFNIRWTGLKASERAERVAECYAANCWSRICDSAREGKRSVLDEKARVRWADSPKDWPLDVERWLSDLCDVPTPEQGSVVSSGEGPSMVEEKEEDELSSFPGIVWISEKHVESLIIGIISDLLNTPSHRTGLFDRIALILYTVSKGLEKHLATAKVRDAIGEKEITQLVDSLKSMAINYSILAFVCPPLFGANVENKGLTEEEVVQNLDYLASTPHGLFAFPFFAQGMVDGDHLLCLDRLWLHLFRTAEPISINNSLPGLISKVQSLVGLPIMRERLVQSDCWLKPARHPSKKAEPDPLGIIRQTFLGRLLLVTMVDWNVKLRGRGSTPSFYDDFVKTHVVSQGALPSATQALSLACQKQTAHLRSLIGIIKTLLKHGDVVRTKTLDWLRDAVESNLSQAKMNYRNYQSQMPRLDVPSETLALKIHSFPPLGVTFNLCWLLLELCKPIRIEKINDIDALFGEVCRHEADGGLLGPSWLEEARMRSDADLEAEWKGTLSGARDVKFTTQIFWLTLKAQRMLFYQCVNDALQRQYYLVQTITDGSTVKLGERERVFSQVILWHTLMRNEDFSAAYMHFVDLANAFVCRTVYLTHVPQTTDLHPHSVCQLLHIPASLRIPEPVSLEFRALPAAYVSDTYEAFFKYAAICVSPALSQHKSLNIENAFSATNCELFTLVMFIMLGSPDTIINSPPMRIDVGGRCLSALDVCDKLKQRVFHTYVAKKSLASTICLGFVHAQKLTYYSRIEMRLILTRQLESLLKDQEFRDSMSGFARSDSEDFERFLLYFASNTSYVLEEAITFLTEIKTRESKPQTSSDANVVRTMPDVNAPLPEAGDTGRRGSDNEDEEFSREADRLAQEMQGTRNVEEMDIAQLSNQCQSFMEAGSGSLKAFSELDLRTFAFIRDNKILIQPTVSCLNSCLASLVGPKCMALKVSNFEKYKFRPREFLANLVKIYVKLRGEDDGAVVLQQGELSDVVKVIREDVRYYSQKLFEKAVRIVRREALANQSDLKKFITLVEELGNKVDESSFMDDLVMSGEVPDEFIDPLMSDIMTDPVLLPTSGVIVERSVIERHLLSDQFDPFNRMPLEKTMLVPQVELKQRILQFIETAKTSASRA